MSERNSVATDVFHPGSRRLEERESCCQTVFRGRVVNQKTCEGAVQKVGSIGIRIR